MTKVTKPVGTGRQLVQSRVLAGIAVPQKSFLHHFAYKDQKVDFCCGSFVRI